MRGTLLLATVSIFISCSEAGLQPIDDHTNALVDDLLEIRGMVCASDPTEAVFPVKIMLIVDCSGSMQLTDPSSGPQGPGRQGAAKKLVDRFKNNPAVSFAFIRFNGRVVVNGADPADDGFTNDLAVLNESLSLLAEADILTDYQGALSAAYEVLQKDMFDTAPVDRIRTKYVVLFLSDGGPNPTCHAGCDEIDDLSVDGATIDSWCDVPRDRWCDNFLYDTTSGSCSKCYGTPPGERDPAKCDCDDPDLSMCEDAEQNWYPGMIEPCKEYNSGTQLAQKIGEILDLGEQYNVGELRFHTAFLYVDGLPPDIQALMGAEKDVAEALLKTMATAGQGLFRSFNAGQQIDFLSINYSTVARPFGMTNFIVTNTNAQPEFNTLLTDSDGDGLDDKLEFQEDSLSEKNPDSDGDGYNDKMEYDRLKAGFDPGNFNIPVKICLEREDLDGDGLNGCEENILGTNPKIIDTDRDRIPDGLEFLWGTNPLKADAKTDLDFDGKLSGEEIRIHSSPVTSDPEIHADYKYVYDVQEQEERADRKQCYDFKVRRLRLVTTEEQEKVGTQGYNNILIYFGEGPADDPRDYGDYKAACVRAAYVAPSYKYPADGKITLEDSDFMPLPSLLRTIEDARTDPTLDPCVGAPLP